jgi:putative ABC transport system permease protein
VRDWSAFVRSRLSLPGLTPERESRIVRELAAQLEDFYRDALDGGASEAEADAVAVRQIEDWGRLARDLASADPRHAQSRLARLADRFEPRTPPPSGKGFIVSDLLRDARLAIRSLTRAPGFALAAILTLALGIGATSAIFSVVYGVVLRPLPYAKPDSLAMIWEVVPNQGRFSVAPANLVDWRREVTTFRAMAAFTNRDVTLDAASGPEQVPAAATSWELFDVLGVRPAIGRSFTAAEDAPGEDDVVVLSHGAWQRRFGGDTGVLGRRVTINGQPVSVIGVMPAGFQFPSTAELWLPLAIDPAKASRGGHFLGVIGRIAEGSSLERAGAQMKTVAERLATQYPDASGGESAEVVLLHDQVVGRIRPALLTLFAAVALTVLIACANVANLMLVRASVRQKELAIRGALGAGRARLMGQMLVESLVLAVAGGAVGVALAWLSIRPIQALSAGSIPRVAGIGIDLPVLGFAFAVSLVTGIVFGLAPAWQAARAGVADVLKEGGRSATSGARWVRSGLLVVEVALSMVLLVGAALLLRSFAQVTGVDPGFRAEGVLSFRVSAPRTAYKEDRQVTAFYDALRQRLEALPTVGSVGLIQALPLKGDYMLSFALQGRPATRADETPSANYRVVTPRYFEALGVPLRRGRVFTDRDVTPGPLVAIVDQAFVDRHFSGQDPIGRGIDIGNGTDGFAEIVGVVGNVRYDGLSLAPSPTMYVPMAQDAFSSMWVLVRTSGDPAALIADARRSVQALDPALPAYAMSPLEDVVSESLASRRFSMLLLSLFAAIALCLAAVGLYGVVAYGVSLRTREIGVRMAIGAGRGDVLRMIVVGGMRLALAGVVLGIVGAAALSGVLRTMLFGVAALDPASYVATALVLLATAACACYIPARRAMQLDPLQALRQE